MRKMGLLLILLLGLTLTACAEDLASAGVAPVPAPHALMTPGLPYPTAVLIVPTPGLGSKQFDAEYQSQLAAAELATAALQATQRSATSTSVALAIAQITNDEAARRMAVTEAYQSTRQANIDQATATAQAMQIAGTATAQALQAAEQASKATATVQARDFSATATQHAFVLAAEADAIQGKMASDKATAEAVTVGLAITQQAINTGSAQSTADTVRSWMPIIMIVLAIVLFAIGVVLIIFLARWMDQNSKIHETASGGVVEYYDGRWRPVGEPALLPAPDGPPTEARLVNRGPGGLNGVFAAMSETERAKFQMEVKWGVAVLAFAHWGSLEHFSNRRMIAKEICTDTTWRKMITLLTTSQILLSTPAGTEWAPGWFLARLRSEITRGILKLPYPTDKRGDIELAPEVKAPRHKDTPTVETTTVFGAEQGSPRVRGS